MLDAGARELAQAFFKLSTERQLGMSAGPIPIRAIWEWEAREGIWDAELREFVEAVLMGIDALVCQRMRKESEVKKPPPEPSGGANRPPARKRRR